MRHRIPHPSPHLTLTSLPLQRRYIEQFVMYHLFIGVDLIYLYDNEDEPTYHRMFTCNPRVKVRRV
jgi:hypothetical protein